MKFDFKRAGQAFVPSLQNSWKNAVAGASVGFAGTGFGIGGAIAGGVVAGAADTLVSMYEAGKPRTFGPR